MTPARAPLPDAPRPSLMVAIYVTALIVICLTGCSETSPATPADHETAKADCRALGSEPKTVIRHLRMTGPWAIITACQNGVGVSRVVKP